MIGGRLSCRFSTLSVKQFMEYMKKEHLRSYVNQALLKVDIAEIWNCSAILNASLLLQILTVCVEQCMRYVEESMNDLM
jgi:hypothetical protein